MPDMGSGTVPLAIFFLTLAAMSGFILELRYLEVPENEQGSGPGKHGSGNGTGEGRPLVEGGGGGGAAGGAEGPGADPGGAAGGGAGVGKRNESEPPVQDVHQQLIPFSSGAGGAGKGESSEPDTGRPPSGGGSGGAGAKALEPGGGSGGDVGGFTIKMPEWVAWTLAVLVGVLVAAGMARFAWSYLRAARKANLKAAGKALAKEAKVREKEELLEELQGILDEGVLAVEGGGDIRSAIVLCYARLISAMAQKGILRERSTTPREFRIRWAELLGAPSPAMAGLTDLFEEAVYSVHSMGEEHRTSARRHLELGLEEVRSWKQAPATA
jgi:hypothetical protein